MQKAGKETPSVVTDRRQTRSQTSELRQRRGVQSDSSGEVMVPKIRETMPDSSIVVVREDGVLLQDLNSTEQTGDKNGGINRSPLRKVVPIGINRSAEEASLNRTSDSSDDEFVRETSLTEPLLRTDDNDGDDEDSLEEVIIPSESSFMIAIQVFLPFLIAGFGTVGAGLVLDVVQVSEFNISLIILSFDF